MKTKQREVTPALITHQDAAVFLGVRTRKLLRWAKNRSDGFPAPVRRVERTYLFSFREVREWAKVRRD